MYAPIDDIDYDKIVFFDFEAYSESDLRSMGAYNYSIHNSTEVLTLCYKFKGQKTKSYFVMQPGGYDPIPDDIMYAINNRYTFVAFNLFFDFCIWNNVLYRNNPKWGYYLRPEQTFDVQALGCSCGLPQSLEGLSQCLELGGKDPRGEELIKILCMPRKPTKKDPRKRIFEIDLMLELVDYCARDVNLLELIWDKLPKLSYEEYIIWYATHMSNYNGVPVDIKTAQSVINIRNKFIVRKTDELRDLTDGYIQTGGQVAKFKEYLENEFDIVRESLDRDWVQQQLEIKDLDPKLRKLLQLRSDLGKSSFAKFDQLLNRADDNGVLRQNMIYHGASTGRWTSKGVQLHNALRHKYKTDLQIVAELIQFEDDQVFETLFEDPMKALSGFIRSCIWSCGCNDLYWGDLSQIEARMVLYLAGEVEAMTAFRQGRDLYKELASTIYGIPVDKIGKDSTERYIGKKGILSSGYGAGGKKFATTVERETSINMSALGKDLVSKRLERGTFDVLSFCRAFFNAFFATEKHEKQYNLFMHNYDKYGLEVLDRLNTNFAVAAGNLIIKTYRDKYPKVPKLWKVYENTAIQAMLRNKPIEVGLVTFKPRLKENLFSVILPSGRPLNYWKPHLKKVVNRFGKEQIQFRFFGVDQTTKQYLEQSMYGGQWTENIDQAICRDIIADRALALIEKGYRFLFSVHDENITINPNGNLDEFQEIMVTHPTWLSEDFPLAAESERGDRWHK